MRETEEPWKTEEFASHRGRPGAVLADGTEPKPVVFDIGSGTNMHETSDWWIYDGEGRAPYAPALRASCSCGWRGTTSHTIDWQEATGEGPDAYDTSGPHADWEQHITDVENRTVPIPEDVTDLLTQLRSRLDVLADDAPLAALRVLTVLEHPLAETAEAATFAAQADGQSWDAIATGLGLTAQDARTRLYRYARRP
ncbi:hypothetical protein [Streptomyces sp. NBC_01789]|uniref:hypothetical protein n=1 Tax=Streptomyces sp. NBC_01789 TaxID=2975941 RepID=UPI00225B855E|nr:hypothetical protein [Streptomyces sp. NBC_01789]MCX4451574.1 hypothetical protein [Streptomyces sp. NBC_01789]